MKAVKSVAVYSHYIWLKVPSAGDFYCPLTFSRPSQPVKCATDRVYSKSPSTVWHFIFLPHKSNEALIDSLHWFNTASPGWNTAVLSDGNWCVYIYWMWMYRVCGVAVAHVGLGFCGFGYTPRDGCTAETSRLCLQHLSTLSKLPAHYYQDLMGLSCPRSLRLYHLPWDNNSASSVALIEILYLLNLHYCWRVAEYSLGHVIHVGNSWTLLGRILVHHRGLSCVWIEIFAAGAEMHDSFLKNVRGNQVVLCLLT